MYAIRSYYVHKEKNINVPDEILSNYLDETEKEKFNTGETGIFSVTISAYKKQTIWNQITK